MCVKRIEKGLVFARFNEKKGRHDVNDMNDVCGRISLPPFAANNVT